jgi:hypothetical protein
MADTRSERLGVRGTLTLFESTLRLLGGANATGAIASGAALHAFAQNADVQGSIKLAGLFFLFGVLMFVGGYIAMLITTLEMDFSLRKPGETGAEEVFPIQKKTPEESRKSALRHLGALILAGVLSFAFFMVGIGFVMTMAVHLQFS